VQLPTTTLRPGVPTSGAPISAEWSVVGTLLMQVPDPVAFCRSEAAVAAAALAMSSFLGLTPDHVDTACEVTGRRLRTGRGLAAVIAMRFRILVDAVGGEAVVSSLGGDGVAGVLSAAINQELAWRGSSLRVEALTVSAPEVRGVMPTSAAPAEPPVVKAAQAGALVLPVVCAIVGLLCVLAISAMWLRLRRRRARKSSEQAEVSTADNSAAAPGALLGSCPSAKVSTRGSEAQEASFSAFEAVVPPASDDFFIERGLEHRASPRREAVAEEGLSQGYQGQWLGEFGFSAHVQGCVLVYRDGREQDLVFKRDGSVELAFLNGARQRGRLLGEQLLWDTGEVWRRARLELTDPQPGRCGSPDLLDCWSLATGVPVDGPLRAKPDTASVWFCCSGRDHGNTLLEHGAAPL